MFASNKFKERALFLVNFSLTMMSVGRTEMAQENMDKFTDMMKASEDPQPVCGLFTKVNFKDDGMEGIVWGIEYISGTFYYAIVPHDLVGDATNYTEEEFDVQEG